MKIAFFISDHGFGHVMRTLPVIKEIAGRGHEVKMVCGEKHIEIAQEYLGGGIEYISYHTDAGIIVVPGTLLLDKEKTRTAVETYVAEFHERILFGKKIITDVDRVVVDIVPWALVAAKEEGVPSYLMASFTWIEQYEGFVGEQELSVLRNAFCSANNVLAYDLLNRPTRELLGAGTPVGFVAREFHEDEVENIRAKHNQPIVFLSLGGSNSGLDFEIDVTGLPYDFIATEAIKVKGNNVSYLELSVPNSQDYVKAADFCIAKAGWSTVSEMMLAGVRFGVLTRPDVPEDTMIIEELEQRKAAIGIDVSELRDMASVMRKLESYERVEQNYENGYMKIADLICKEIDGDRDEL